MRSGRSFLLLLVVALGLGAYIYFVELKRDPASTTESTRTKVFDLAPGSIQQVQINNASGDQTTVVKQDTTWRITQPEPADADTVEVAQVVSSIETLEQSRVVAEDASDLSQFGLAPARITLTFKAGDASQTLKIGNKTPTGGDMYATTGDSTKVVLIPGYLEDTFNKTPFSLRDKSVLRFAREAADSISITHGSTELGFTKSGDTWRLSAPVNAKADASAVDALVSRLFQARMAGLVTSDGTAELAKYGLARPQAVVVVGAGSSRAELAIGSAEGDANVYARDMARPMVFTVEKALLDDLKKSATDLRSKDLFDFRSFNASSFDVTMDGTTYSFVKKAGEGDNAADVWTLTTPSTKTVDATKMTDLLTTASNLRAESFVTAVPSGGSPVAIKAQIAEGAGAVTESVTFRKVGSTVHAMREGEPGAAVVSTIDFDKVVALVKELAGSGQ